MCRVAFDPTKKQRVSALEKRISSTKSVCQGCGKKVELCARDPGCNATGVVEECHSLGTRTDGVKLNFRTSYLQLEAPVPFNRTQTSSFTSGATLFPDDAVEAAISQFVVSEAQDKPDFQASRRDVATFAQVSPPSKFFRSSRFISGKFSNPGDSNACYVIAGSNRVLPWIFR